MNAVSKLYLKVAVRAGTAYALLLLLSDLILEGTFYPVKIIFFFFFMGLLWSIGTVSFHVEQIKALGVQNITDAALKSTQIRTFCLELEEIELIEELLNDATLGKMSLSKKGNTIRLRSGIEGESLGTVMTITQLDQRDGAYVYEVKSRPRMPFVQLDLGKSLSYIMRFEKLFGSSEESADVQMAS